jgi:hypothetical protein
LDEQLMNVADNTVYQLRMKDRQEVVAFGRHTYESCHASHPKAYDVARCKDGRVALIHVRPIVKSVTCTVHPDNEHRDPPCLPRQMYEMIHLPVKQIEDVLDAGEVKFEYTEIKNVTEHND